MDKEVIDSDDLMLHVMSHCTQIANPQKWVLQHNAQDQIIALSTKPTILEKQLEDLKKSPTAPRNVSTTP